MKNPFPLLFWFSITEDDIKEDKLSSFKLLKPIIDGRYGLIDFY